VLASVLTAPLELEKVSVPKWVLPTELDFYQSYAWCLNPHLTVFEATDHLRGVLDSLTLVPNDWQVGEVATNVFLLSCGLLNCVDDYLRGPTLRLPSRLAAMRIGRGTTRVVEGIAARPWSRRRAYVRRWRERWLSGINEFLSHVVTRQALDQTSLAVSGRKLAMLLQSPLPPGLQAKRVGIPSPFSRLDLTQKDVLALGERFVGRFPDRSQAILLLGLRTSGSYFAPLLKAFFDAEGYQTVSILTVEPDIGPSRQENRELKRFAERRFSAVIVDDAPHTAGTVLVAFDIARRAGFAQDKISVLVPTHPARRDWLKALPEGTVVTLYPEQWHKPALLDPKVVECQLAEYFRNRNVVNTRVVASRRAEEFNAHLQNTTSDERSSRLKRIFEVQLETSRGQKETRYVLAKSVGWGWFGYHAFLAGHRLSDFVPPILGLRDGILYMEWIPQAVVDGDGLEERNVRVDIAASYVAARVHRLNLKASSIAGMDLQRYSHGARLLEKAFSRAYGRILTDTLVRSRLGRLLRQQPCPFPTLIDGNMRRTEWIGGPYGPLKTDYEHHGMGKMALNVADPAYDLADAILNLALSPDEESRLIRRYVDESKDVGVEQRLFMNKLLAGIWAMNQAKEQLFGMRSGAETQGMRRGADMQQELHQRFMNAWNFLTVQTARYCGSFCRPPADLQWRVPLVALDIDGVLDQRLFGYPSTTAAGIEALSLLHAHGLSVALNTARSVGEVQDYCQAYSLNGGIAEHGSYLWDAVNQRGRVLISPEAARQLEELKRNLQQIPGVFLDDRHQYSIRAFTYQVEPHGLISSLVKLMRPFSVGNGALVPLSSLVMHQLMTDLGLDRLCFHHTTIDTTIVAKEVDKGTGLLALREWIFGGDVETFAVGDNETDLAMFRVATRCFAPANISCSRQARLLGCQIARHPYQRGLLEIARALTHPDGRQCERCARSKTTSPGSNDLVLDVLQAADQSWATNLIGAVFDPGAFKIFVR
jgi:hydroxymethylpyrimidine pyrophosphatase-like HAD family hydrolase